MIPNAKTREVTSKGVTDSGSFGISLKDSAHIMTILRDTLYSDKILAVLREYSSNAWDANREAGKADVPIRVHVPTSMDPTLVIEDVGPGLSHEDVFQVYTQYGASTKRDSDLAVGMLGIGSKSGFAYSDSFTVVSKHRGMKRTYVAVLDEANTGTMQLLHEELCGDETGVQIKIPVQPNDARSFEQRARSLFQHFEPRPDINIDLPPLPEERTVLGHGILNEERGEWVAVMGCVPYRVNLEQLRGIDPAPDGGIGEYLYNISGVVHFGIGEVEISASREELKYSDKTKEALVKKLNLLVEEFIKHTITNIEKSGVSFWEKRLRAQILSNMGLPIPKAYKDMVQSQVEMKFGQKPSFYLLNGVGTQIHKVPISSRTRLFVGDDSRKLKGFNLSRFDIVAKPNQGFTVQQTHKELRKLLRASGLAGLEIERLSSVPWHPRVNGKFVVKQKNKKHNVKSFRLRKDKHFGHPWSECWEIIKRAPTDGDVFVIVHKFQSEYGFYDLYRADRYLAKAFGKTMPEVYGYKTVASKPVTEEDCQGTEYRKWRVSFHDEIAKDPEVRKMLDLLQAAQSSAEKSNWRSRYSKHSHGYLQTLIKNLGKDHPITKFFVRQFAAQKRLRKLSDDKLKALCSLNEKLGTDESNVTTQQYNDLLETYPLFATCYDGFAGLWDNAHFEKWSYYVHLVDQHEREVK